MIGTTILETDRLRLSAWTAADSAVEELLVLHGDPEVARYIDARGRVYSRQKAEERLVEWRQAYAENGLCKFRLSLKADDSFVGRAGFAANVRDGAEIGYALARAHWGLGYAKEIAAGLRDWFFATRPDPHFIGFAHVENRASRAVLERIGMVPTHQGVIAEMPHQFYIKHRSVP